MPDHPPRGVLDVRHRTLGADLAIPLTLLTKAMLLDVDPNTRWISHLVAAGQAPPNPESPTEATD